MITKRTLLTLLIISIPFFSWADNNQKPRAVKNVILMIPDGTSIGMVTAARWYKTYNKQGDNLNIDPYFCGTVRTYSSNAPIGDSAPTTSCYMTGMLSQAGNVAIYPVADPENDLVYVDPAMAYQPLVTILEASKIEKKKATGLVATVEFSHATPADCSAHYYDRNNYDAIASQMAYNNIDVMFGGGTSILTDDIKQRFRNTGTTLIQDDLSAFRKFNDNKIWALFGEKGQSFDIDRDTANVPSLEEMTRKAIQVLSKNDNGFFLMVEGSKVDQAAHSNDAIGCITEFLAFDKAVGVALEFAKRDGETAVIILPDHGNSGFSIGRYDLKGCTKASLEQLFGNVSKYKRTTDGLEKILLEEKPENFKRVIKEYTDIELTDTELTKLLDSKNYKNKDYTKVSEGKNLKKSLSEIMNKRTYFGFTSGSHTGEEVFLAAYHPHGDIPIGAKTNVQINQYLFDVSGLETPLPELTDMLFAKHTHLFSKKECTIETKNGIPTLIVKRGKDVLEVQAFKSVAYFNGEKVYLPLSAVYIDKNNTFYLSMFMPIHFDPKAQ